MKETWCVCERDQFFVIRKCSDFFDALLAMRKMDENDRIFQFFLSFFKRKFWFYQYCKNARVHSVINILLFCTISCLDSLFSSKKKQNLPLPLGASINDVTALGGRGYEGFCDNSIKALLKSVTTGGRGVKNYQKLRDVIYGRPLIMSEC